MFTHRGRSGPGTFPLLAADIELSAGNSACVTLDHVSELYKPEALSRKSHSHSFVNKTGSIKNHFNVVTRLVYEWLLSIRPPLFDFKNQEVTFLNAKFKDSHINSESEAEFPVDNTYGIRSSMRHIAWYLECPFCTSFLLYIILAVGGCLFRMIWVPHFVWVVCFIFCMLRPITD